MRLKNSILKSINMIKKGVALVFAMLAINSFSQKRVKVDGVAVVVGENIVLDSDVEKFKLEVQERSEGKIVISDCEMLEELMLQKLQAHHAVIDSIVVSDSRVEEQVENTIKSFSQQLGGVKKVIEYYGFNDEADFRAELTEINREQLLIQGERESIISEITITPDEVRTYFKSLETENVLPEFGAEIELAQIVIYGKPTRDEIQRVKDKLNQIKTDVENGSSMQMKALLNSDDPSVSGKGMGAGGFFSINRDSGFDKTFKEVAFSLTEGEVSDPFKSDFGYHVIQVEKIRGQQVDLRHVLIQPNIDDGKLKEAEETLTKVKKEIEEGVTTFEQAVLSYSQDKDTATNEGVLVNPQTGDSYFELLRMDPTLYSSVASLNAGEMTEPFYDETRNGEKMFKILLLKSKSEPHIADYVQDYVKIQAMALQKKQEETIEDWAEDKIKDTYIKINEGHTECDFSRNWSKD